MGRRCVLFVLTLCVLTSACRGGDDDTGATAASTTSSTSTTLAVDAPSIPATTTTSVASGGTTTTARAGQPAPATTTTTQATQVRGIAVDDAPRDPYVDRSDNTGSFVYAANTPKPHEQIGRTDNDPLTFRIGCSVANDGHGSCRIELTNHVRRNAQFPNGLTVTVTLRHDDGSTTETTMAPGNIASLRPGETAIVDGTIDVFKPGGYTYFATTTVHWP